MASLLPTDVPISAPIEEWLPAMLTERSAFVATGAAGFDSTRTTEMGGNFITVPRITQDVTADEKVDGSSSTPSNVGAVADVVPIVIRKRVRAFTHAAQNVLGTLNGAKLGDAIVSQTADYWARRLDAAMVSVLTGLFDGSSGCLRTTHRTSIAAGSGTAVGASYGALVDAATKLGDNFDEIEIIVAHSKVVAELMKARAAKSDFDAFQTFGANRYRVYDGKILVPWDSVPTSGSGTFQKYTTLLVRRGALYFAWQTRLREIIQENAYIPEYVYTQVGSFAPAARGTKWAVTDVNPTNAVLADPTHWEKSGAPDKEIGVVALETNATSN